MAVSDTAVERATLGPPPATTGFLGWMRKNLFGSVWNTSKDVTTSKLSDANGIASMLAWAMRRRPCSCAKSRPRQVRSNPYTSPSGSSIARLEPVPQPQSRMRGASRPATASATSGRTNARRPVHQKCFCSTL